MSITSVATIASNAALVGGGLTAHQSLLLMGPDYVVRKSTNSAIKSSLLLGSYTGSTLAVSWPLKGSTEVVDQSYTSVQIDTDGAQRYYSETARPVADSGSILLNRTNRLRFSDRVLVTANGSTRASQIPVDFAIGDWVRVTNGSGAVVGKITNLIADVVASSVGTATAYASNVATNAGSSTFTAGGTNTSTAAGTITGLNNQTNYHGEAARQLSETYTLTVTNVGANGTGNGGNWSTVTLSCTSLSGTDPAQTGLVPVPATPLSIGSRGARVQFSHGGSGNDWVLGDTFTVVVTQAYTVPTVAAAGTYTGTSNATYLVKVTQGGLTSGSAAKISVSTTDGTDVTVSAYVTSGVAISIGTRGATFTFTGTTLFASDTWTVACTAQTGGTNSVGGAIRTIELDRSIETTYALMSSNWIGQSIQLEAAVAGAFTLPINRVGYAPTLNVTQTASTITIAAGAITYTTRTGSTPLTVVAGTAYVSYRAARQANVNVVRTISSTTDMTTYGIDLNDDPDTYLSYALYRAFTTSGGNPIRVLTTADSQSASFTAAQPYMIERTDWRTCVPLTTDSSIRALVNGWVATRSTTTTQLWSDTVVPLEVSAYTQKGATSTATVTLDALATGTQYTLVTDSAGTFVTSGVAAGDQYRTNYSSDGFGNTTYDTYTVLVVLSNQQLRLVSGPALPISSASQYQVQHPNTAAEKVAQIASLIAGYNSSRIIPVGPTSVTRGGVTVPTWALCVSVASLRALAAGHQPLTTVQLTDYDSAPDSITFAGYFSTLIQYGMYTIQQLTSGEVTIQSSHTSAATDADLIYDSVRRGLDSMLWVLRDVMDQYRATNMVDDNIQDAANTINTQLTYAKTKTKVTGLGPLLVTGTLDSLAQHSVIKSKLVASLSLGVANPIDSTTFNVTVVG